MFPLITYEHYRMAAYNSYLVLFRYLEGRVFVVEVLPDSQTEVDEIVLAGDIIDEINGVSLRHAYNGQVRIWGLVCFNAI